MLTYHWSVLSLLMIRFNFLRIKVNFSMNLFDVLMICFGVQLQSHQIDDKIIRLMTQVAFVLFFDSYKFDFFMPEIDKNHWFFIAKVPGQLFY